MTKQSDSEIPLLTIITSQYLAALAMLRAAIEAAPDDLWDDPSHKNRLWRIAYHACFYTHLYLSRSEADFVPWSRSIPEVNFLGPLPWPPHREPATGGPYSKEEILACHDHVRGEVARQVAEVPLGDPSGFPWLPMNRTELHFYNIRHVQHHAGQMIERLRSKGITGIGWVGMGGGAGS